MHNGANGNGYKYRNNARGPFGIRPLYLYIGIAVLALLALWFLSGLLSAGITAYFSLAAGVLLVLGNLREVLLNPQFNRANTALLNTLIGGALILFFVGSAFGALWFIPAVLALLVAAPLMLGRADVYGAYVLTARTAVDGVRRVISNVTTRP